MEKLIKLFLIHNLKKIIMDNQNFKKESNGKITVQTDNESNRKLFKIFKIKFSFIAT